MADFNLGGALSAFGQAIATNNYGNIGGHMQAHGQNRMQMQNQQKRRNMTADYLQAQGADPQLIEMARSGMAKEAFGLWGQQQKANQPAKMPSAVQEYEYARGQGFGGSYLDFQNAKKGQGVRYTAPDGSIIQVGGASQPAGQNPSMFKQKGKNDANLIKEAQDGAVSAQAMKSTLTQMKQVAPKVGYTGPMGELYGKVDDVINILPGDSGARGAFKNMSMEAQLSMTEKTKGAITDREMGMFKAAVPGLSQTPEGNQEIIKVMEAAADRSIQRATALEQWVAQNGTTDGFTAQWNAYLEANPLILENQDGTIRLNREAVTASASGTGQPDLSSMSDAELEAIANGQ